MIYRFEKFFWLITLGGKMTYTLKMVIVFILHLLKILIIFSKWI